MPHATIGGITHVLVDGIFKKRDRRLVVDVYDSLKGRFHAR